MRLLIAALLMLSLGACAPTIKKDPNLVELTASAERQNEQGLEHDRLMAKQRAEDEAQCMKYPTEGAIAICFLGKTATTLASRGGAGSGGRQTVLPNYTPPPTGLQQVSQAAASVSPMLGFLVNGVVSFDATRQANQTARYVAGQNAQREIRTVEALANQPPAIQVGAGGVYAQGNVQQVGGHHADGGATLVADSDEATFGVRQGDNGVAGSDNDVRNQSPDIINSGNCVAGAGGAGGPGAPGAPGGSGGDGGTGPDVIAGAGAPGGPGGLGGNGGSGGTCAPAPLPRG